MDSTSILAGINQVVQLNQEETGFLESILIPRPFKQGEIIVKAGDAARYLMFVNAGYLMTYYSDKEGNDHVIQFATGGWWCGDVYGIGSNATTLYTTKGLSEGELLLLPRSAQEQLFEKYNKFERYFRIFFHNSVLRQQQRLIENYTAGASERYRAFNERFVGMEQYVPQKHIASYLGITPEFLSKVRKKALRG
jgi:CRP-like cAMP-binding protein